MKSGFFDRLREFFQSCMELVNGRSEPDKPAAAQPSEGKEASKRPDQSAARGVPTFADIEIAGGSERKRSIPVRPGALMQKSAGEDVQNADAGSAENMGPVQAHTGNIAFDKFITDMHRYADREGMEADFVSFDQVGVGYDGMSAEQQKWYFCWRSEVRAGRYPDTAPACVLIHAQEILNGCGWESAADGLDRLVKLWTVYREKYPQIDRNLFAWTFDFARTQQLDFAPDECADIPDSTWPAVRNLLVDRHRKDKPLKLSLALIEQVSAYAPSESRFYRDGHEHLVEEAMPRVIALADAALLKKDGKGILRQYGPRVGKKQRYCVYADAVHPEANRRVEVTVRAYVNTPALRNYIGGLLRHAENVLRGICKFRGRLRVDDLDEEMAALIEGFLKREYSQAKRKQADERRRVEVQLDFDSIDALRIQSDAVRDALEVVEEETEPEPEIPAEFPQADENAADDLPKSVNNRFALAELSDDMNRLIGSLSEPQTEALWAILVSQDAQEQLERIAEDAMTMPEILIDEINDAATQVFDDILIDAFGDAPRVLEQYESEIRNAARNGG